MRIILIDTYSGFIWGDSADLNGKVFCGTPQEYAAALDESLGTPLENNEQYVSTRTLGGSEGYAVYRADVDGSEAVPVVLDGQARETIETVERDCQFLGYLIRSSAQ